MQHPRPVQFLLWHPLNPTFFCFIYDFQQSVLNNPKNIDNVCLIVMLFLTKTLKLFFLKRTFGPNRSNFGN